jgi:hypothetical protein
MKDNVALVLIVGIIAVFAIILLFVDNVDVVTEDVGDDLVGEAYLYPASNIRECFYQCELNMKKGLFSDSQFENCKDQC